MLFSNQQDAVLRSNTEGTPRSFTEDFRWEKDILTAL